MANSRPDPRSFGVTVLIVMLVAYGPISTDMYLPSLPAIAETFGATVSQTQLTLSIFMAGFAVAQLVYGPLSDRFGRRPVLLVGLTAYAFASAGCMTATSIEGLILARFIQSLGACAAPVLGRAVVRDIYERDEAAKMFAYLAAAMAFSPLIAPVLGGWMEETFGWQATFAVLAVIGTVVLFITWFMLAETNRYRDPCAFDIRRMLVNYRTLLRNREFLGYTLTLSACFGGMFAFISGSSFTLVQALGMAPQDFGFAFAVVVAGFIVGSYSGGRLVKRFGIDRLILVGTAISVVGAGIATVLAWGGVATLPAVVLPVALYFAGCGAAMPNSMAGAIGPFPAMAGAASALLGFIQMTLAASAGFVTGRLFDGTTRVMPSMMLIMSVAALVFFMWLIKSQKAVN